MCVHDFNSKRNVQRREDRVAALFEMRRQGYEPQIGKRQKLEDQLKTMKLLTRGYKAIRATATATLAISHTDDAGQDEDNTGYKPQEAGGEPQVDAGVADGSADVGCRRQQEAEVQNDLDENEPPRMLRWF